MVSDPAVGPGSDPETRLWALIEERIRPGADLARIDAAIWREFGEPLAVVFTDLSGFSRLVAEFGIVHFLQVILEQKRLFSPLIERHGGQLLKIEADSMLIVFRRPADALACVLEMQRVCAAHNASRRPEDQVLLCVGLGYGDVLKVGAHDVFGQEVNAASKLGEDLATANEILVTDAFRRALDGPEVAFEPIERDVPGSAVNHRVLPRGAGQGGVAP
jgi:class 3 adenylate cyclase